MRALRPLRSLVPVLAVLCACDTTPSAAGGSCGGDAGLCLNLIAVDQNLVAQAICQEVVGPGYAFHPDQACPLESVAGICTRIETGLSYAIVYSTPPYSTDAAAADCAARDGAFQPP
ncbi:MAG TPA: hypothetical protein PLL32_06115 [Anaeromyxobacteraceae bacterium]|nr:hypothetical protein [Anaeromyxobacteraceae bacterium]